MIDEPNTNSRKFIESVFESTIQTLLAFDKLIEKKPEKMGI